MSKKSNPNAELEGLATNITSLQDETGLAVFMEALKSPYEPNTTEDTIFTLCRESHASVDELATILCLDRKYLADEYADVIKKGYTACKIILRRQQFLSAKDGDSKQLTWLGKQVLGQEDKIKLDVPMTIMVQTGVPRQTLPDVVTPILPAIPLIPEGEDE